MLSTEYIYKFRVLLAIGSDHVLKQQYLLVSYNADRLCAVSVRE